MEIGSCQVSDHWTSVREEQAKRLLWMNGVDERVAQLTPSCAAAAAAAAGGSADRAVPTCRLFDGWQFREWKTQKSDGLPCVQ